MELTAKRHRSWILYSSRVCVRTCLCLVLNICHDLTGECSNAECMYRHVDPDKKRNECPYYARGFCKHGPKCRLRHVKKEACHDYLAGFCKNGPDCVFGHARFEIPRIEDDEDGPGGIDRFGFGRPKGPMPIPKMPSAPEENVSDAPNLM